MLNHPPQTPLVTEQGQTSLVIPETIRAIEALIDVATALVEENERHQDYLCELLQRAQRFLDVRH